MLLILKVLCLKNIKTLVMKKKNSYFKNAQILKIDDHIEFITY